MSLSTMASPMTGSSNSQVHWEAADAADPGDGGNADETDAFSPSMPKPMTRAGACSKWCAKASACFVYDNIAKRAIAAGKK
jgi:hypothetical protein